MSRIERVLRAFESQPWAIQPEKLDQLAEVLIVKAETGALPDAAEIQAAADRQRGRVQASGATAVLPLFGTISRRMNMLDAMSGGSSIEVFQSSLEEALGDDSVANIVIVVDSPGGSVEGVEELSRLIFNARSKKRIIAVADALAASAAYYIASAADELVVTPSGQVGSIGVFLAHFDMSEAVEREGIKVSIIRAGENKAEGNQFEPLGDDARAHLQSLVDDYYGAFVRDVARNRGVSAAKVEADFGQGRTFTAQRALARGMVDRIATLDEVLAELAGPPARRSSTRRGAAATTALDFAANAASPTVSTSVSTSADDALLPLADVQAAVERIAGAIIRTEGAPGRAPSTKTVPTQPAPAAKGVTVEHDTAAQDLGAETRIEKAKEEARAAERKRVNALRAIAKDHAIDDETADRWVAADVSVDQARKEALARYEARSSAGPDIRVGSDREAEAPFPSFGHQIEAIVRAGLPDGGEPDKRLLHLNRTKRNPFSAAATGASQGDPSSLGFVVAPQFSSQIWNGLNADEDNLLARVDSYPVEGESISFPANAETSRATGSRWGGVRGYWIAEADQITSSKPKLRQVKLEPQELAVLVYLTNKLIRHAPAALEAYVTRAAVSEIGFLTSNSIIRGTGAGQPLGLLNSGSIVSVAKETSQAAATVVPNNVSKMWSRLHPNARRDAIWLANTDVEPALDNLNSLVKNVAETENVGGYAPKIYNPETGALKGRPVVFTELCETLGTVGDLILWSPSGYAAGTRAGVESEMSIHLRFDYAESALRFMYEVDGQPWLASALTPFKGTNTLTTHVSLATRA